MAGKTILEICKTKENSELEEIGEYRGMKLELQINVARQEFELFLKGNYEAVVTYEFSIINMNKKLVAQGKEPETDFINVTVWNKPAENIAKYLSKGRQVAIEGRIQTRSYDNNEGKKTYVTEVIANNVEFLGSANDNNRISPRESEENPFDANIQPPETTNIDKNNWTK